VFKYFIGTKVGCLSVQEWGFEGTLMIL